MAVDVPEKQLARWAAVSLVLARVNSGMAQREAVAEVAATSFICLGSPVSRRTLYRWLAQFKKGGFEALGRPSRALLAPSRVLSNEVLAFLSMAKTEDDEATIPDIIRSMETIGLISKGSVSRTTLWRAAQKLGLPIFSGKSKKDSTKLKFHYKNRMQMVLCDGKQFRAGAKRRKRLAFIFIDDASRKILGSVVGRSENKRLFLRGVMQVVKRYGFMNTIYTDNGSGFIAKDSATVLARIGIGLVNGTEGYPEGRGKIERFNRTLKHDLLRTFNGDPTIKTDYVSLEMRFSHYTESVYNKRVHGSLKGKCPDERWASDALELNVPFDMESLESKFRVTKSRKVRNDNILPMDSIEYEVPFGHAGTKVLVEQDLLHGKVSIVHEGKSVLLKEVDPIANSKIVRKGKAKPSGKKNKRGLRTSARRAFARDYESVLNADGDFFEHNNKDKG